ncbi:deoxyribodipyrimidine photo-lyase [Actinotalea sp.]|uniref:cryptochrome/photolyase family protein n=1 Tax=Actinotalea sp. TaxID=1872145 RepID=UPI0035616286
MTSILWLRRDLRLHDHPALVAAHEAAQGSDGRVLPLFVADPTLLASAGPARLAALHEALTELDEAYDGALVVRRGRPQEVVPALAAELGAGSVHVSAETTPYGRRRDAAVADALDPGIALVPTGSPYAVTPGRVLTGAGEPYQVFTPFSRAWREHGWRRPAEVPTGLRWHEGVAGDERPGTTADEGAADGAATDRVGERSALERWSEVLDRGLEHYGEERDRPDLDGTSRLSAQLKYGTIHPRTLLAEVAAHPSGRSTGATTFVTELAWREFYADVLWHRPSSAWSDLRPGLSALEYDDPGDPAVARSVEAWRTGRTGYPFVDAGMRQLQATGWMHNRLRMVTASFLVKDLHVWWVHGARHFLEHLRDGDIASNNHGWQWVAGTGTDAAPYFRVFNPVLQGERFDPQGDYVRRWVPELRHLAGAAVHQPWKRSDGYAHGYPERVVDHAAERAETLRRYGVTRD